jgi:hypothetical protein
MWSLDAFVEAGNRSYHHELSLRSFSKITLPSSRHIYDVVRPCCICLLAQSGTVGLDTHSSRSVEHNPLTALANASQRANYTWRLPIAITFMTHALGTVCNALRIGIRKTW